MIETAHAGPIRHAGGEPAAPVIAAPVIAAPVIAAPVIVVPDGVAASPTDGRAIAAPSFAFRACLERAVAAYRHHPILLAPANDFGCGRKEQELARDYLATHGIDATVTAPGPAAGYVDTRGNAAWLRRHLEALGLWPIAPAILVTAAPHARRARLCFLREGFPLSRIDAVGYPIPADEFIVPRLWYYRHPFCHAVYESLALVRDFLRP